MARDSCWARCLLRAALALAIVACEVRAESGSATAADAASEGIDQIRITAQKRDADLLDVADLERIEVLRGPQGDLWGRNTTAGAIQLITRAPSGGLGARASLAAGTKRQLDVRSSFEFPLWGGSGVPVPDALGELSGALGLVTRMRDAFYPNPVAADSQEMSRLLGRAALTWERGDFRARYTYHGARVEEQGPEMQLTELNASAAAAPLFDGRTLGVEVAWRIGSLR